MEATAKKNDLKCMPTVTIFGRSYNILNKSDTTTSKSISTAVKNKSSANTDNDLVILYANTYDKTTPNNAIADIP